jgi:single-strand DNA-binding protein
MSMNLCVFEGRLTADPKFAPGKDGDENKNRASFHLAVNDPHAKEKRADFINCVAWGNRADIVSKWCKKGKQVTINGRLRTNTVQNADGTTSYYWECVVNEISLGPDAKDQAGKSATPGTTAASAAEVAALLKSLPSSELEKLAAALSGKTETTPQTSKPAADPFAEAAA